VRQPGPGRLRFQPSEDSSPGGGYECILTDGQTELYCSEATDGNVPAATIHGSLFEA